MTQVELSRLSGLHQSSVSQFLNGRIYISDEQFDRLLSCVGHRLEVVHTAVEPELTRSERRSWLLHRRLSLDLTRDALTEWRSTIEDNLGRLERSVTGQPHQRHLMQWRVLVESDDVLGIKRVLTGLDRESIEMREVSPLNGLLSDEERSDVLSTVG